MLTKPPTVPVALSPETAALGERFRKARERRDFGLKALSDAIGLSINTIRWHEAGARMMRLDQVEEAARAMGCDVAELTSEGVEQP